MNNDLQRRLMAEFFGTFWLVFGGCGAAVATGIGSRLEQALTNASVVARRNCIPRIMT